MGKVKNTRLSIYLDNKLTKQLDSYVVYLKENSAMPEEIKRSRVARNLLKIAIRNFAQAAPTKEANKSIAA